MTRDYARRLVKGTESERESFAALRRLYDHYLETGKRAGLEDVSWLQGELDNVLACAEDAISRDLAPYVWELPRAFAVVLQVNGLYDRARFLQEAALAAARLHGASLAEADAHMELAVLERHVSNHETALAHVRGALDLYVGLDDRPRQANAHTELGVIERDIGNYQAGREHLRRGLDMYMELGSLVGQANAHAALSSLEREAGDYDQALVHLRRALVLYTEAGNLLGQANVSCDLGVLNRLAGAYSEARNLLRASLFLYERLDYRIGQANVHSELGDLYDEMEDKASASEHRKKALAIYAKAGSPEAAEVRRLLQDP